MQCIVLQVTQKEWPFNDVLKFSLEDTVHEISKDFVLKRGKFGSQWYPLNLYLINIT